MYCCNYDVVDAGGKKHTIRTGACFGGWFTKFHACKSVTVFVLKDYTKAALPDFYGKKTDFRNHSSASNMAFTSEQVYEYVRLLRLMGFHLDVSEVDGYDFGADCLNDCYVFHLNCSKNSTASILILVNAIRYLYESTMPRLVEMFLEFSKQKVVGLGTAMKFMLAHICCGINGGHAMYAGYIKPFSNEEFRKRVINNPEKLFTTNGLFEPMININKVYQSAFSKEMHTGFKGKSLKEIFKTYKQICVKSI